MTAHQSSAPQPMAPHLRMCSSSRAMEETPAALSTPLEKQNHTPVKSPSCSDWHSTSANVVGTWRARAGQGRGCNGSLVCGLGALCERTVQADEGVSGWPLWPHLGGWLEQGADHPGWVHVPRLNVLHNPVVLHNVRGKMCSQGCLFGVQPLCSNVQPAPALTTPTTEQWQACTLPRLPLP